MILRIAGDWRIIAARQLEVRIPKLPRQQLNQIPRTDFEIRHSAAVTNAPIDSLRSTRKGVITNDDAASFRACAAPTDFPSAAKPWRSKEILATEPLNFPVCAVKLSRGFAHGPQYLTTENTQKTKARSTDDGI